MAHRIRLRAGWIRHSGPLQTKVGLPDDTGAASNQAAASSEAAVHYRRPFNCPSGLDAAAPGDPVGAEKTGDRSSRLPVDLVVEKWTGMLVARLDNVILAGPLPPSAAPLRVAVADRLSGHHRLSIDLEATELTPPRLTGIVFLEIHSADVG